jgi:hypothetical protein
MLTKIDAGPAATVSAAAHSEQDKMKKKKTKNPTI